MEKIGSGKQQEWSLKGWVNIAIWKVSKTDFIITLLLINSDSIIINPNILQKKC